LSSYPPASGLSEQDVKDIVKVFVYELLEEIKKVRPLNEKEARIEKFVVITTTPFLHHHLHIHQIFSIFE
jgi:hypothetical protein